MSAPEDPAMSGEKPSGTFWACMALLVVVVLYPLSIGPVCCLHEHKLISDQRFFQMIYTIYFPIAWLDQHGPLPVRMCLEWYAILWRHGF
jgi:hypothetical protein